MRLREAHSRGNTGNGGPAVDPDVSGRGMRALPVNGKVARPDRWECAVMEAQVERGVGAVQGQSERKARR